MPSAKLTFFTPNDCRVLHAATLEVLAGVGVEARYAPAVERFRRAGAEVCEHRVRIPARLLEQALASAPREWVLRSRGGGLAHTSFLFFR